ncbi:Uncharacterised protein [Streptococcus pneumoniae]|nr:Uncharacterised protein [Streptococcus pneumoniae]
MVCFFSFYTLRKSLQTAFENLFKPRQRCLTVGMVTDFAVLIYNLKAIL